jgi:Glyoxalase/Bleomycin resistance protein/Dioxygenase superfamily
MSKPRFREVSPIFPVSDVGAALAHYASLGFRTAAYADGDGYGFAERGQVSLHLTFRPTSYYPDDGIAVAYMEVDDADAVFAEWTQPGVKGTTTAPEDMPWRMHEGVHRDPDGNVIRFGAPVRS